MTGLSALIVAAGRGIRMGPRGELTPKGLLKIDDVPLVVRSVNLLKEASVPSIRIVTGHLAEQYEACFRGVEGVELVHNPDYATTGSLHSMMTGLDGVKGPIALLESDLIYEKRALSFLNPSRSTVVASGETGAGDEVYIWTRSGARDAPVFDFMSKDIQARPDRPFGELTGISCFNASDADGLRSAGAEILRHDPTSDYEPSVVALAQMREIACDRIDDLAWTEIDDEEMYARALGVVWPQITVRDSV